LSGSLFRTDENEKKGETMRSALLWTTASVVTLAFASAAYAQTAAPLSAAGAEAAVDEIVVTGSRISRRDFVSPTPIVTATQESLQASGAVNVEQGLNQLPQFVPAGNSTNGGRGGGQRATLNLRGLGANRNLVLLDGRRLPFASAAGETDVNIIPQAILQGVETITGGASAVYGSDAMSGVVNFITRRNFEGVQLDVQYGNTFQSDLQRRDINITGGGNFADDRGNAILSVGYTDRERLHGDERDFYDLGTLSSFLGYGGYVPSANNLPSQAAMNAAFARYGINTTIPRTQPIGFNDDGTLFTITGARNYRGRTTGDYVIFDGNVRHPFAPTLDISSAQERRSFFGKMHYDLKPGLTAYTQILYVDSVTDQDDGTTLTQFGTLNTIPVTNPFIPADLRPILASRTNPTAPFEWNSRYVGVPHKGWTDQYKTSQFIGGIRGDIGVKDWTFDAYFSTDKTNHISTQRNAVVKSQVANLWNAPDGGRSICAGGYNPFGDANAQNLSAACIDYITATIQSTQDIKQDIVEVSAQGSLFALPAGDVRFSVVAGQRTQNYDYTPDSRLAQAGNIEAANAQTPTRGKLSAKEIAGELLIPLLRDRPMFESLNIGVAYRYSDYNFSGGNSTYKIDGDWTVIPGVLLRGGYARAVRAPNMGESFFQGQIAGVGIGNPPAGGEPCDSRTNARAQGGAQLRALCIATGVPAVVIDNLINPTTLAGNSVTNGNPLLRPEQADTFTAGVVLRPQWDVPFISNVSLSVDFYDIKIADVIGTINGSNVLNKCYNLDGSNPTYSATNRYCQLIQRDPNGLVELVQTPFLNLGGLHVRGIDVALDWRHAVGPGFATFSTLVGYKIDDETKDFEDSPWRDFAGTGTRFKWQALTSVGYEWGPAQLGLRFRYYDGSKDATSVTRPASPSPGVKPYYSFDLNASYQITEDVQVRAGVTNLFDTEPLITGGTPGATNPGLYDVFGRSYFMALRAKF
jgi:iron complex outermembrane recepter protein